MDFQKELDGITSSFLSWKGDLDRKVQEAERALEAFFVGLERALGFGFRRGSCPFANNPVSGSGRRQARAKAHRARKAQPKNTTTVQSLLTSVNTDGGACSAVDHLLSLFDREAELARYRARAAKKEAQKAIEDTKASVNSTFATKGELSAAKAEFEGAKVILAQAKKNYNILLGARKPLLAARDVVRVAQRKVTATGNCHRALKEETQKAQVGIEIAQGRAKILTKTTVTAPGIARPQVGLYNDFTSFLNKTAERLILVLATSFWALDRGIRGRLTLIKIRLQRAGRRARQALLQEASLLMEGI